MSDRLTYKNEDKFYLKWGVDQELDELSPEVQEIVRGAIEKLGKYEDSAERYLLRTETEEWKALEFARDKAYEENTVLKQAINKLRDTLLTDNDMIHFNLFGENNIYISIIENVLFKYKEPKEPKKLSKNWIFNRFGQR